nr:hypothetical protein [Nitrosomonas nitrosa]
MDDTVLSSISSILDKLDGVTSLALVVLVAVMLATVQKDEKIKIASVEVAKEYAGVSLFALLCGLIFHGLRLLQNLNALFAQISSSTSAFDQAIISIRYHSWFFNPFAETSGNISFLTDNIGYSLLLLLWWLGFHTGFFLLRDTTRTWRVIGIAFFFTYLIFGLLSMMQIASLIEIVNDDTKIAKQIILLFMIPVGSLGVRLLMNRLDREITQSTA